MSDDTDYNADGSVREQFRGFLEYNEGSNTIYACFDSNWGAGWQDNVPCGWDKAILYTGPLDIRDYAYSLREQWNQANDPAVAPQSQGIETEATNGILISASYTQQLLLLKPQGNLLEQLTFRYLTGDGPAGWNWNANNWMILPNNNGVLSNATELRPVVFTRLGP